MSTIASLVATLGLDASGFNSGIDDASSKAGGLSSSLSKIGLIGFGAAATGIAGLGVAAFNASGDFDSAVRTIETGLGVTRDEAEGLGDVVKGVFGNNFGSDMASTAGVVTTAFQTMGDVGNAQLQDITENALRLQDSFGIDTTESLNAASTLMKNFGLSSTEAFDLLTSAQQKGLNGSGDLLETIGEYSGLFAGSGADASEFFSILESGYQAGVLGTDKVADSFKEFSIRLVDGSETTSDALAGLGIDTEKLFQGITDGSVSGADAYGLVTSALSKIDDPLLKNQLGVALLGTQYEDMGAAAMDGVTMSIDALGQAEGATASLDAKYNDLGSRMSGAWRQIQLAILPVGDAIRNGLIVAFDTLFPKIVEFGGYLAGLYEQSAPVRAAIAEMAGTIADTLMPKLTAFGDWFTGNSDAMAAAGAAIGGILVAAFVGLSIAAGAAAVSMVAAALPFVAIIAVAAALGAGIYLLITHWDDITAKFPAAGAALEGVKNVWAGVLGWITGEFMPGIMGIADAVMNAGSAALGFVQGHWDSITAIVGAAVSLIATQVQIQFELIGNIISGALQIVSGIINTFVGLLTGDWQRAWDGLKSIASGVWQILTGIIQAGIATIQNIITNGGALMSAAFGLAMDILKNLAGTAWDGIKAAVSAGVAALPGLISAAGGALSSAASAAWDAVKGAVSDALGAIKGFVSDGVAAIPGLLSAGAGAMLSAGTTIMTAAWDGLKAVWSAVVGWVPTLPGIAADMIRGGVGLLLSAGVAILTAMWDGAKEVFTQVVGWLDQFGDWMRGAIVAGVGLLLSAGQDLITNLWDGAKEIFLSVLSWAKGLPGEIVSGIGDVTGLLFSIGQDIVRGMINGVKSMAGEAVGAVKDMAGDMVSGAAGKLKVWSPSRVFMEIGENVAEGLAIGVTNGTPEAVAAGENMATGLTGGVHTELSSGFKLLNSDVHGWTQEFTGVFVEGFGDGAPEMDQAMLDVLNGMSKTWDSAADGFLRDTGSDLIMWQNVLKEGLAKGKSLSVDEIETMFMNIGNQIAHYRGDMSLESASAIDEMFVSMVNSMRDGGGVANAEMIDVLNILLGHIQQWYPEMIGVTEDGLSNWSRVLVDGIQDGSAAATDAFGALMRSLEEKFGVEMDDFGTETQHDIKVWTSILEAGLKSGTAMSTAEIGLMFESLNSLLESTEFPAKTAQTARTAMDGLITEFKKSGSLANTAMIDVFRGLEAEAIPTMEEVRANIQANFATWGGTFATEMRHGGRMVGDELTGLLDSLTASIETASLSGQAEAEAFAMLDKMIKTIDGNEGRVTNGVDRMLGRIQALILDPANVAAAATGTTAITTKIEEILTTATPLVETAAKNLAAAAIEGFESQRLKDVLAVETRNAMFSTQQEILLAKPPVQAATASLATSAIDGWEHVDFGTFLINTINANMNAAETAITTAGADIASGLASGVTSGTPDVQAAVNAMGIIAINTIRNTVQSHSDSKVFFSVGKDIGSGLAAGITASTPTVQAAVTTMGTQVITTGTAVGADIGSSIYNATISEWDDIGAAMKTIGETAATDGGAAFANRWMTSLQAGIDAGTVSVATAAKTMQGVLQTVMDAFAGSALYLGESRGGWATLIEQRNALLLQQDPNGPISATFHGAQNESTVGIGGANGYWDMLSQQQQAAAASSNGPRSNIWTPSPDDVEGFSHGGGNTYVTVSPSGYYRGPDELLRDLNEAAKQAGAPALLPA